MSDVALTFEEWVKERSLLLRSTFDPTLLFNTDDLEKAMEFGWNARQAQIDALEKIINQLPSTVKQALIIVRGRKK